MSKRLARRLSAFAAASIAAGALSGLAGIAPASAATFSLGTDYVRIAAEHVDFGNYTHSFGQPWYASVFWTFNSDTGIVNGEINGHVFYDHLTEQGCGRARIQFKDAKGNVLRTRYTGNVCRSSGWDLKSTPVDMSFASTALSSITVRVEYNPSPTASSTWRVEGSSTTASITDGSQYS